MATRTKADQLAEEMSRFEQEILGASESAPKGPSSSTALRPISTPNTSTPPQLPSQFFPRPPGPPGPPGPPHPPTAVRIPGPPPQSAPRPLLPPRPNGPPQFQGPPGPPMGPPPNMANGPPRLVPPPHPSMPQQFPRSMPPPPPPQQPLMPSRPPPLQPPPMQPPPAVEHRLPPMGHPHPPAPAAPLIPYQQPVAKPTLRTPVYPTATATTSSKAGTSKSAGAAAGAEGGAMEGGLLPLPTKPKRWRADVTKLRLGGGQVWQDHSLEDWEHNDFRIFVGDLGNDVNDDLLARTFSKYPTFLKARVIRDKWTKKAKGYGFVSFKDPHDFMQAMREMNGKYIGNRPMKLRKSTWKDRMFLEVKKKEKAKKKLGFKV